MAGVPLSSAEGSIARGVTADNAGVREFEVITTSPEEQVLGVRGLVAAIVELKAELGKYPEAAAAQAYRDLIGKAKVDTADETVQLERDLLGQLLPEKEAGRISLEAYEHLDEMEPQRDEHTGLLLWLSIPKKDQEPVG